MSTVCESRIPSDEFALERTLAKVPDAEFDIERAIPGDMERITMVLWAHGPDYERLRTAIDDDPAVAEVQGLVNLDTEWLYRLECENGLHVLEPALTEHDATLMHAYGNREGWHLRLLVPERDALTALMTWCERRGLTLDVERVFALDERLEGRFGLTENQYEALAIARERGYYESPRRASASELAADLGISQQAFSERLRRASGNLLDETIASDDPPTAFSYPDRWRTRDL